MSDDEFNAFVAASARALKRKNARLTKQFGLGAYAEWAYDQPAESLRFSDAGRVRVEARAVCVGSFSTRGQTWQWAWANPSIPDGPRANSARIKELFDATGLEVFHQPVFEADEEMAWELAAMSVAHLGAGGCYRGVVGQLWVFLAVETIRSVGGLVPEG